MAAVCFVCQQDLSGLRSLAAQERHINQCLDRDGSSKKALTEIESFYCDFCGKSLCFLTKQRREQHLARCLEQRSKASLPVSMDRSVDGEISALERIAKCPCCLVDWAELQRNLPTTSASTIRLQRISHVKNCIRIRQSSMFCVIQNMRAMNSLISNEPTPNQRSIEISSSKVKATGRQKAVNSKSHQLSTSTIKSPKHAYKIIANNSTSWPTDDDDDFCSAPPPPMPRTIKRSQSFLSTESSTPSATTTATKSTKRQKKKQSSSSNSKQSVNASRLLPAQQSKNLVANRIADVLGLTDDIPGNESSITSTPPFPRKSRLVINYAPPQQFLWHATSLRSSIEFHSILLQRAICRRSVDAESDNRFETIPK
jgi:hypothetical protein